MLFGYQDEGVKQLLERKRIILADDMGLGKTIQVLEAIKILSQSQNIKALGIIPPRLKTVWMNEWRSRGYCDHYDMKWGESCDGVSLVSNSSLDTSELPNKTGNILFCDEAHAFKNRNSKRTNKLRLLARTQYFEYRWMLSGTPVQNKFDELWPLLYVVDPPSFGSYWGFVEEFGQMGYSPYSTIRQVIGLKDPDGLKARIDPYILRRMREDYLDLPNVSTVTTEIKLSRYEQHKYNVMERNYLAVFEHTGTMVTTLPGASNAVRLLQIATSPDLMDTECPADFMISTKLSTILADLHNEKSKVVLFTMWKKSVDYLAHFLKDRAYKFYGGIPEKERIENLKNWKSSENGILLATIATGAEGWTFIESNIVYLADLHYNPSVIEQAISRVRRIGQESSSITVKEYYVTNTIEDTLRDYVRRKHRESSSVIATKEILWKALEARWIELRSGPRTRRRG